MRPVDCVVIGSVCLWLTVYPGQAERTGYIKYYPGDLNLILAAPHGGVLEPDEIPDRTAGCFINKRCVWTHDCGTPDFDECKATTVWDMFTSELTMEIRKELRRLTTRRPHVIINTLKRTKLDANRDRQVASFGNPLAEQAWDEFHGYINTSKMMFNGPGVFFDIHGHGKPEQWVMLGYLIRTAALNDGNFSPANTSIRNLALSAAVPFPELIVGENSFGAFLDANGVDAVPSPKYPGPGNASFYSGGYNTRAHGSRDGGDIDAIQIESPGSYRTPAANRAKYARAVANAMSDLLTTYYGYSFPSIDLRSSVSRIAGLSYVWLSVSVVVVWRGLYKT